MNLTFSEMKRCQRFSNTINSSFQSYRTHVVQRKWPEREILYMWHIRVRTIRKWQCCMAHLCTQIGARVTRTEKLKQHTLRIFRRDHWQWCGVGELPDDMNHIPLALYVFCACAAVIFAPFPKTQRKSSQNACHQLSIRLS